MLKRLYLALATSVYIVLDETYCVTPLDADVDDGTESTVSIRITYLGIGTSDVLWRSPVILFFILIVAVGTYFTI